MAQLSLSLLGTFEAALDGKPLTAFSYDKVRALLAYLAVESDRAHSREALAGMLWPDMLERRARQNLSQALYDLRRLLGDEGPIPFLIATRHSVQFEPHADHQVDAVAFVGLLKACELHPHADLAACDDCVDRMQQAMALYRGDFLAGFSLPDSPPFEEWSLLLRERFHHLATEALERLARVHEQRGQVDDAARWAVRWAQMDPWHEHAHRLAMRLLAGSGKRAAALSQYETCCRILGEELGIEPEPETVRLYGQILGAPLAPGDGRLPTNNLPAWLTPLIGRARELAEVEAHLQDPNCRMLTLFGPGGIGKTRLAVEAAQNTLAAFPHGSFLVSLAALRSVEPIYGTIAEAIGFSAGTSKRTLKEQVLDYLREKRMLLILDSFEHLIAGPQTGRRAPTTGRDSVHGAAREAAPNRDIRDGVSVVADLLHAAPALTTLITSRARLNVQGEHLYPLTGLDVPPLQRQVAAGGENGNQPQGEGAYGAVQLFLSAALRVNLAWSPTGDDLAHVSQICRVVEGMPLAILLAAAWVEMLSPAEIAAELGKGMDLLQTEYGDLPDRQRSMRAVFDQSWNLLTPRAQEVMQALSVFRGGCTRQSAQEVAGASLRELMALVHRSRLHRTAGPQTSLGMGGRYHMHELLRQHAEGKLSQSPDGGERVRERHCAAHVAALQRWAAELKGAGQEATLKEMDAEIENARDAWYWAVERGQAARLASALEGLCLYCDLRIRFQEGETLCRSALSALGVPDASTLTASGDAVLLRASLLIWQARFNRQLGRVEEARRLLEQSACALAAPELPAETVHAQRAFILAEQATLASLVDREQGIELYRQSLAEYRTLGDRWHMAQVLRAMGEMAHHVGNYGEADGLLRESLTLCRSLGDQRGIAEALEWSGFNAFRQGRIQEGTRLARESIALGHEIGDRAGAAAATLQLARTLLFTGAFAELGRLAGQAAAVFEDLGMRYDLVFATFLMGWAQVLSGHYDAGRALLRPNLALAREIGSRREVGYQLYALGQAALADEAYDEAQTLLQESVAIFQELGQGDDTGMALSGLAYAKRGLGQAGQARQLMCQAIGIALEIRAIITLLAGLPAGALLLLDQGEIIRAIELYALVRRHPSPAGSVWHEDVAGKQIAAASSCLPPEVVEAAQERGRGLDLWQTAKEVMEELAKPANGERAEDGSRDTIAKGASHG